MKLTKPQAALLVDIHDMARHVYAGYAPAKRLVELGLAEWRAVKYGTVLKITEAGLAALKEGA